MSDYDETLHAAQSLTPDERLKLIARLWVSLPEERWPVASESQLAEADSRLAKLGVARGESVPWPVVEQMLADCVRSSRPKVYSAPRRFDLATIFVVTSAYAVLFGGMAALNVPAAASALVGAFITIVGIGQALLFQGLRPRTASIITGVVIYAIPMIGIYLNSIGVRIYTAPMILMLLAYAAIGGVVLGYIAGAVVGSVFLVADYARGRFARLRSNAPPPVAGEISPFDAS